MSAHPAQRGAPVRPWRGLLVVALWVVWPALLAMINLAVSPGPACPAGVDCAPTRGAWPATVLWLFAAVVPGAIATVAWRRWRRDRDARSAPGA